MRYEKISEEKYRKLMFQLGGQYGASLNVFRCYGLEPHVDQAIDECVKVADRFGQAVRGDDMPIHLYNEPKARATE